MKNLQQAIDHARQVYESYRNTAPECGCAMEHLQLANWLEELKSTRARVAILETALKEIGERGQQTPQDNLLFYTPQDMAKRLWMDKFCATKALTGGIKRYENLRNQQEL